MNRVVLLLLLVLVVGCAPETPFDAGAAGHGLAAGPDLVDARDHQVYPTVVVGGRLWMARNLSYDTLDGTRSFCPDADPLRCRGTGRYYAWSLAMAGDSTLAQWCDVFQDRRGLCPEGWHLPDTAEWDSMAAPWGIEGAGRAIKSKSGWAVRPDGTPGGGADSLGFDAKATGYWTRGDQGYGLYGHTDPDSAFLDLGYRAAFWTRSNRVNFSCNSAWGLFLSNEDDGMRMLVVPRVTAMPIRCVRDSEFVPGP